MRLEFLKKEQSLGSIVIGTIGAKMLLKMLKKEQSLESLAIDTNSTRKAIGFFEEGTKCRKPYWNF